MSLMRRATTMLRRGPGALAILIAVFAPFVQAQSGPTLRKMSRDLNASLSQGTVDAIVQFRNIPSTADLALVSSAGGLLLQSYSELPAALFRVPSAVLGVIAALPNVRYISPDRSVGGKLEFAGPTVGADMAFRSGWTGQGIGIAIIDSGISSEHPDVRDRILYAQNFVPRESTSGDPYGHGTHVAVAAAGNASASSGGNSRVSFRGIAPRANLISLRVLDSAGSGRDSWVIAGINRAIELRKRYNIKVLNLSLGRAILESYADDPLCAAVERAWKAGIVVVVAAGNGGRDNSMGTRGYATISSPGNSPQVITVGAMRDMGTVARADDLMTSYSSKGPTLVDQIVKPDLVAPGNMIVSGMIRDAALRTKLPNNVVPLSYYKSTGTDASSSVYFRLSGTSIAAPIVSGAAALLLQQTPSLSPDQVKARLMKTATKAFPHTSTTTDPATGATYEITYDIFTVGAGCLDITAALNSPDLAEGPATSPRAVRDASSGSVRIVSESSTTWVNENVWGSAIIWGSSVIVNGTAIIWGSADSWGGDYGPGYAIIWGSQSPSASSDLYPMDVTARGEP